MKLRCLCLLLALAMTFGVLAVGGFAVKAAEAEYALADLLEQGKIKPLGRTQAGGHGILGDWSGSGFQMNVSGNGGAMSVGIETSYDCSWAILVDGEQVFWERIKPADKSLNVDIPAGDHQITVIKESELSNSETAYCDLTTLTFGGTIEAAPANKDILIEFVGDSYTCGHGTIAKYEAGKVWSAYDHSFLHAYPWYTSQILDADYTIAAKGGIGLFKGVSAQEGTTHTASIADIYDYASGYRKSEGLYGFERHPDIIIIEIGANDTISTTDANKTIEAWKSLLEDFTDQIRAKNPDAAIVFWNHRAIKVRAMMQIVEERKETDPNLYAFTFSHQGNGAAAIKTQFAGHPSAQDSEALGKALAAFLVEKGLVPQEAEEITGSDLVYYASEKGNDANDGKTIDTAKKTLYGALTQAKADNATFAADARVVVYVEGTVNNNSASTQMFADAGGTLKNVEGKNVPVLVTTYNYSGTKATVDTNHKPGDAGSGIVYFCNDVTMKDICFQSTTYEAKGTRDYRIFTGYNQVTFDNVTFAKAGSAPTAHQDYNWQISATHIVGTVAAPTEKSVASVTFKNGDYTDIDVAAVWTDKLYNGTVTSSPTVESKVIIGAGAKMGTVYNRYGNLVVGSSCVEVRGGSVQQYIGSTNGTSKARKALSGDVNFYMSSGTVTGNSFNAVGTYVTVNGNINNTISGGTLDIRTTADYDGIFFGGRNEVTVENINNTISGGGFYIRCDTASYNACYFFGGSRNAKVNGNVTNKISGGSFIPLNGAYTTKSGIYFGQYSGSIQGTLYNEISAGTFDMGANANTLIYMGGALNPNATIGKIVNIFGQKDSDQGPVFYTANLRLTGALGQVGVTSPRTAEPAVSECSDTVVVSNTFYGGMFERNICCTGNSTTKTSSGYYTFVKGSVENNIYGGQFCSSFIGAGYDAVYGKVTTNIYGGHLGEMYAGGASSVVYDGVELNIYDFVDYATVRGSALTLNAGSIRVTIPTPQTKGRPSIKLTVAPTKELTIYTPLAVSAAEGEIQVSVNGGIYPNGFGVAGVKLADALAEGYMPVNEAGVVIVPDDTMTSTGTSKVTVQKVYYGYISCADDAQKVYTTDENASESKPAHIYENGMCTVCSRLESDEIPPHEHTCDHCQDVQWKAWNGKVDQLYAGGHFYLVNETDMSATFSAEGLAKKDIDVTICLNGQTLNGPASGRMFRLSGGAKVTIVDCTATTMAGTYTAGSIKPQFHNVKGVVAGIYTDTSGEPLSAFTLYDGIIDGGNNSNTSAVSSSNIGGGLLDMNSNNKINLYGGVLKNYTSYYGGAVYVGGGTLTVDGGTIKDCNATRGRAIMIRGSAANVTIESGEILGGTSGHGLVTLQNGGTLIVNGGKIGDAKNSNGNGVHIMTSDCVVEMNGGEISGNSAYGIWVENGTFYIKGGTICGNLHGVVQAAGTVYMSGGEIRNNTGSAEGTGVRINAGIFNMSGGKIYGNTSTGNATGTGGVRVSGEFNMTGGEIYDNTGTHSQFGQILPADAAAKVNISENAVVKKSGGNKCSVYAYKGVTTISGGDFSGAVITGSTGKLSISGGMFDTDVTAYVAEGYEQYVNGKVGLPCEHPVYRDGICENCGQEQPEPEIQLFNLKGSSMTLGNTLEINFAVAVADITGENNYIVVSKEYADGSVVSKTYPQAEWTAQGKTVKYVSFSVTAKEMNDQLTVIVYNENGQQISNTYTDSVAGYCQRKLNEEEKRTAGPRAKYLTLYVDMLGYGAAAQQKWNYNVDDLANAELTETQKGYATVIGEKENILQKGEGYKGTSLSLKDNILMNVAFNTSFLTDVKYAEVNFVSHNGVDKSMTVAIEDFIAQGSTTKYISIDVMAVADYAQPVTVKLYNAAGECVSTTIDSMGSYAGRQANDVYLYEAILAFGMGAYNYFHS